MNEFTGELIHRAANGDQGAIAELYELTYSSVYKTIKSMIADEDTVLDIVQDSYIKGFQSLAQLDTPENFRAWMKRIAINKAKDYMKKKKPILFTDLANEEGEEVDFRDECLEHCPEEILAHKEAVRLMNDILSTLSEEQRLVIGMFYYEEMSVREIAETLECSENTVKSRLNYGRKKVEVKVKELEKKGIKLYSLAPLPFLLWLFRMDAEATELPSDKILEAITTECAVTGTAVVESTGVVAAAGAGAKTVVGAGVKALATKIVAGVLAVSVVGGGTMLALSHNDREEVEQTHQIVSEESISQIETSFQETAEEIVYTVSAEEAYQDITAEYQAVIEVDSATFLNASNDYFNGDHVALRYYHMYHGDQFYYAYIDIDGNGMEELLIGFGREGYIKIVDLYSFDSEQVVQLIDEPTLGDRSALSLLNDGTLYLNGSSSATEATHAYLRVDGCAVKDAPVTIAAEVTNIPWKAFEITEIQEITVSEISFDSILVDIQEALAIAAEDYEANKEYYDGLYSHLGDGVMWMLLHRQAGNYTMCIWNTYLDIDGDGQDELCIGRGVSPSNAEPIVIYKSSGEAIYGDALYAYNDLFYGSTSIGWNYIGG